MEERLPGTTLITNAAQDFQLLTTLKHTLFNAQDIESELAADAPIRQWKEISKKLFALHTRRLREAAEAFGWKDVATRLSPASDEGTRPPLLPEPEDPINLPLLVEDAAAAAANSEGASPPGPARGFLRDLRVRVLISRDGEASVECTAMGDDRPLSPTLRRAVDMYTSCPFTPTATTTTQQGEQEHAPATTSPCHVTIDAQHTHPSLFTRHKTTRRSVYDDARARANNNNNNNHSSSSQSPPPLLPTTPPTAREVLLSNPAGQITEASLSAVYFLRSGGGGGGGGGCAWLTPHSDCGGMQSVTRLYALEAGWCHEGIVLVDEVEDGEVVWLSNAVRGFFPGVVKVHGQRGRDNNTEVS